MTSDIKQPGERTDVKAETAFPGVWALVSSFLLLLAMYGLFGGKSSIFIGFPIGIWMMTRVVGQAQISFVCLAIIAGGGLGFGLYTALLVAIYSHPLLDPFGALVFMGFAGLVGGAIIAAFLVVYNVLNGWHLFDWFVNRGDQVIIIVNVFTLFFVLLNKAASLGG